MTTRVGSVSSFLQVELHPHPLCLGDGLWGWLEQAVTTRVGSVSSFLQIELHPHPPLLSV